MVLRGTHTREKHESHGRRRTATQAVRDQAVRDQAVQAGRRAGRAQAELTACRPQLHTQGLRRSETAGPLAGGSSSSAGPRRSQGNCGARRDFLCSAAASPAQL